MDNTDNQNHTSEILIKLGTGLLLVVGLYWSTIDVLMERWSRMDEAYSHGFLTVAYALYAIFLLAQAKPEVSPSVIRGSSIINWLMDRGAGRVAVLVVFFSSLVWSIARTVGLEAVEQIGWFGVVVGMTVAIVPASPNWRILLPLLLVCFALPVWDVLTQSLQHMATLVSSSLLHLGGVPIFVDGNVIQLAVGTFSIVGGCSGLSLLLASLALVTIYSDMWRLELRAVIKLLILGVLVGLFTNWLRITLIILAGHVYGMDHYLIAVDHYFFGWALFAVIGTIFIMLVNKYGRFREIATTGPTNSARGSTTSKPWGFLVTLFFCIAIGPVISGWIEYRSAGNVEETITELTAQVDRHGFERNTAANDYEFVRQIDGVDTSLTVEAFARHRTGSEIRVMTDVDAENVRLQGGFVVKRSYDITSGHRVDVQWQRYGPRHYDFLAAQKLVQLAVLMNFLRADAYEFKLGAGCRNVAACAKTEAELLGIAQSLN